MTTTPTDPGTNPNDEPVEDFSNFIPHRVFINQVDSYHARYFASYITEKFFGGIKDEEVVSPEEQMPEEDIVKFIKEEPKTRFEVIGTLAADYLKPTEDILFTTTFEDQEKFKEEILKCGIIIFDISKNKEEIPRALETLNILLEEYKRIEAIGPKTFSNAVKRTFILISSVMTWAKSKPNKGEDAETAFTEVDYRKRRPHPNYKEHLACEKEVVAKGKKYKDKLKTFVVCSGITYGEEEENLEFLFRMAWSNEKKIPVFPPGNNKIPLIHVQDLARVLHRLIEVLPSKPPFILAVEQQSTTLKKVVTAISKFLGTGKVADVTQEQAFTYPLVNQTNYERCTVNLSMEPVFIVENLQVEFKSDLNIVQNMEKIVEEFKRSRKLTPLKVVLHGPPAVGNTRLAKQLCERYGLHYISVKTMIEETLKDLRENIEYERARIKAKEERQKSKEDEENDEDEDEDEGDEEDEEAEEEANDIEEWEEQIRDIQTVLAESENHKLPDEYVVKLMKTFLYRNQCQNKGYVLDNFPKTIKQARDLFGVAGGGGEGAEGEGGEDDEGDVPSAPSVKNKLTPDLVIGLEADDKFLCDRVMTLPEEELKGTHYTEDQMLRRLATFRENNTEDTTVLNYFDENEMHPVLIPINEEISTDMSEVYAKVAMLLGDVIGFGLTQDEEHQLFLDAEENKKKYAEEKELERQRLETQAVAEYKEKMNQWSEILQNLKREEEKMLVAEGEPLRNYLMYYVFPVLTKGLMEVARVRPEDPVDFLAEYLFRENPEGRMFDPAFNKNGNDLLKECQKNIKPMMSFTNYQ